MKNLYKKYFNPKMNELKLSHHQFVVSKKDVKKDIYDAFSKTKYYLSNTYMFC